MKVIITAPTGPEVCWALAAVLEQKLYLDPGGMTGIAGCGYSGSIRKSDAGTLIYRSNSEGVK